jgi:hypothetical protein
VALEQARRHRQQAEQQARQELGQFRFLGFVSTGGGKQAFLSKGSVMYLASAGETVDGRIEVAIIEAASITLRHAPSNVESILSLSKGRDGS